MDSLCLIAAPRTGANHLCSMLQNFPEALALMGPFEGDGAEGLDAGQIAMLSRVTGADCGDRSSFTAFARDNPGHLLDFLEAVARSTGKRLLTFKLGPDGLPRELAEAEVLERPGVRSIMVVRKQIDSYVSLVKAADSGRWRNADTSRVAVRLDIDAFAEWLDAQEAWYQGWRAWLLRRGRPCPLLKYETDIELPVDNVLRRIAKIAGQLEIELKVPAELVSIGFEKQDRTRAMVEKVSNWAEFSRELSSRGLERRAFGYPL